MSMENAELADGRIVRYNSESIAEGTQKLVYFTEDKSSVICLYKDASEPEETKKRLSAIIHSRNPTENDPNAQYWKDLFCWPTGMIVKPGLGVMCPAYPANYFFRSGANTMGKEKKGIWYWGRRTSKLVPTDEKGDFRGFLGGCIRLARAVARMHSAGLAHSDLSFNNVLLDPVLMKAYVIDIDSLVVPGRFFPQVIGTPGYIAPEVLGTMHLDLKDPKRIWPSIMTDSHALPVLIYQYLLSRHPLDGPKFHCKDPDENEKLKMGSAALFIENPRDTSNRDKEIKVPFTALGELLSDLFIKAFIDGLHTPAKRPGASNWESALTRTWDMLWPCQNKACTHKWFIITNTSNVRCPFCGTRQTGTTIPILNLRKEVRPGQWMTDRQLVVTTDYSHTRLFKWHVFSNEFPGAGTDTTSQAYFEFHNGKWALTNEKLKGLTSPAGNTVAVGQSVELSDGAQIRLCSEPNGRMAEVKLIRL